MPNLPENSIVVLDNASYHNAEENKAPNSGSRKQLMIDWLRNNDLPFTKNETKVELYETIKRNKGHFKTFKIDKLLQESGFSVLRLPPYHPDLNPIEMIWAKVKNRVAAENVDFTTTAVEDICKQKFSDVSVEDWKKRCEHIKKNEEAYRKMQGPVETAIERFVISLGDDSSDSSEDGDEDTE